MKRTLPVFFAATMFLSGAALQRDSLAQAIPELAPLAPEAARWHRLRVENVPPDIMAWWLDPFRHAEPIQFRLSRRNQELAGLGTTEEAPEAAPLPAGVQRVVASGAGNSLMVYGAESGVRELQKRINVLDKPMRQVEVDAQFVQISAEDVKNLPLDFGTEKGPFGVGKASGANRRLQTALAQLIAQNKAKIITAPRVTTFNNLTASLGSSIPRPAVIGVKGEEGTFRPLFDSATQDEGARVLIGTAFRFTVTPTINADDTVTLLIAPMRTLQLTTSQKDNEPLLLEKLDGLQTIANVFDGDTIAVTGLTSRLFAKLEDDPNAPAANVVLFVTPRIIRRAGMDDVKPVALQR